MLVVVVLTESPGDAPPRLATAVRHCNKGDNDVIDPKSAGACFFRSRPDATEQQAIQYASSHFPRSPIAMAQFMYQWRSVRGRSRRESAEPQKDVQGQGVRRRVER